MATPEEKGWVQIQPKSYNLENDNIVYFNIADEVRLSPNQTVELLIEFFNADGAKLGNKNLNESVPSFFSLGSWGAFATAKKNFVLNKWNLVEVPYE